MKRHRFMGLKHVAVLALTGLMLFWAAPVRANAELTRFMQSIELPRLHWSEPQTLLVQSVRFHYLQLFANTSLAHVLRAFNRRPGNDLPFSHVLFSTGRVLLSGWRADTHWLLDLQHDGQTVTGFLSVMPEQSAVGLAGAGVKANTPLQDWAQGFSGLLHQSKQWHKAGAQ